MIGEPDLSKIIVQIMYYFNVLNDTPGPRKKEFAMPFVIFILQDYLAMIFRKIY